MMTVAWILSLCLMQWTVVAAGDEISSNGTTRNLEEIFKGRCHDYQEVINPAAFTSGKKDCTDLWSLFSTAFMYKPPCNVTMADYDEFVEAAFHDVPINTHLLWEQVYPFVNKFADRGRRYFTIADTLTGYMVDNLAFCGQVEPPGVNYDMCPQWSSCELAGDISFWKKASLVFAQAASGVVHVMLNASVAEAFRTDSIFAEYELAYLNPSIVSTLRALLVRDIGVTHKETCGSGSLLVLKNTAENTVGVKFECVDDPEAPRHLLCVDRPEHPQCSHSAKFSCDRLLMLSLLVVFSLVPS